MQLGFVIDQSRCIGCHACTVACKAENSVPLGSFRTWVKYVEEGSFPSVRRSFAVLRCNQCSDAPCVTICPVHALAKRPDGIVDVDPGACIGCKACLQGCPYDALYINESTGTAEKCHFCVHRTEQGLAPACAVVCPTEAILPGDFHDPEDPVAVLRRGGGLAARKPEAGTGPNVLYRAAASASLDPLAAPAAGGYLWAERAPGAHPDTEAFLARQAEARGRTTYAVDHPPAWGWKVTAYLFTKSVAAGAFLAAGLGLIQPGSVGIAAAWWLAGVALAGLAATAVLLVADLKRPGRFYHILTRGHARSWLVRGTWILAVYGLLLGAFLAAGWWGRRDWMTGIWASTAPLAVLTAAYTGWLFRQARGRPYWMRRGLAWHLVAQAAVAGAAAAMAVGAVRSAELVLAARSLLAGGIVAHALFVLTEGWAAPKGREREYAAAHRLATRGPGSNLRWGLGLTGGVAVPLLLLGIPAGPVWPAVAAVLACVGLIAEDHLLVVVGQRLPLS